MNDGNEPKDPAAASKPQQQTGEEHGSVKSRQRGEDDFNGRSDTPRGAEPELRGVSGRRG